MFYELLEDGTIGRSTPSQKVAQSLGLTLTTDREIVYGYDGKRYFKGDEPVYEPTTEDKQAQVRGVRNSYLAATDIYMLIDFPISDDEREEYKDYRQYLRDYTLQDGWWHTEPKSFDKWKEEKECSPKN